MSKNGRTDDHSTIDAIVAALYDAISFGPGGEPDWQRLQRLFHPEGRLIPPAGPDGLAVLAIAWDAETPENPIPDPYLRAT